jgi:hypothetical protein
MHKSFTRSMDFFMIGMAVIFMTKHIMTGNAGWSAFWGALLALNLFLEWDRYWDNKRKRLREKNRDA